MEFATSSGNISTFLPASQAEMNNFDVGLYNPRHQQRHNGNYPSSQAVTNQQLRPLGHALHVTEDLASLHANTIEHRTGTTLQGSFALQHGAVDNSGRVLPLYTAISPGYSGLNGSSNLNRSPHVPGSTGFNSPSGLNQSGMGQPVGWGQIEYPANPWDGSDIANIHHDEPVTGPFPPMVNYAPNSTSTSPLDAPFGCGVTIGNNCLGGNLGIFECHGDASAYLRVPSTQIPASGSLGRPMGGDFASAPTALTTLTAIDEGRPMTDMPIMQPDTAASLSQTGRTPFYAIPAGLSKRRRNGGVPCPEGCGTMLSRRQDIGRHLAQKHAEATLRCPVDGCMKLFARGDKRNDHLNKGHKLGAKAISVLLAANPGGEKV